MAAPYRHDRDALESRLTSVEEELVELQRRKAELQAAVAGEEKLEREADQLRKRLLRDRGSLPMLDQVRVASPCPASWEAMKGDDQVRFCGQCEKNVYDLSSMTRDEASKFVVEHEGRGACIRMHRRADGTLITADCPVGAKRKRNRRRLAGVVFGAGALAGGAFAMAKATRLGGMANHHVGQMTNIEMPEREEYVTAGLMAMPPREVQPPSNANAPPHARAPEAKENGTPHTRAPHAKRPDREPAPAQAVCSPGNCEAEAPARPPMR